MNQKNQLVTAQYNVLLKNGMNESNSQTTVELMLECLKDLIFNEEIKTKTKVFYFTKIASSLIFNQINILKNQKFLIHRIQITF